ncbi:hypothetical protein [Curtobacterium sp. MCBA15_008]|uniref:hypothetical protein n=1 Tax=Curtobacterium sp. MCBA15_008 TaxID=1898736 RepID=UPI001113C7D9|nr:hypothetical protein [Curtobacterium sp. MCBA15_008]
MKPYRPAIVTICGLAAAIIAFGLFGPVFAGIIALATLCSAAFGTRIIGNASTGGVGDVDPAEVRRYREEHPGATITEGIASVARR